MCNSDWYTVKTLNFQKRKSPVEELSVDGGNIRVRTPIGQPCDWKGYKAVRLHNLPARAASFQENNLVIDWVNNQHDRSYSHMYWGRT